MSYLNDPGRDPLRVTYVNGEPRSDAQGSGDDPLDAAGLGAGPSAGQKTSVRPDFFRHQFERGLSAQTKMRRASQQRK